MLARQQRSWGRGLSSNHLTHSHIRSAGIPAYQGATLDARAQRPKSEGPWPAALKPRRHRCEPEDGAVKAKVPAEPTAEEGNHGVRGQPAQGIRNLPHDRSRAPGEPGPRRKDAQQDERWVAERRAAEGRLEEWEPHCPPVFIPTAQGARAAPSQRDGQIRAGKGVHSCCGGADFRRPRGRAGGQGGGGSWQVRTEEPPRHKQHNLRQSGCGRQGPRDRGLERQPHGRRPEGGSRAQMRTLRLYWQQQKERRPGGPGPASGAAPRREHPGSPSWARAHTLTLLHATSWPPTTPWAPRVPAAALACPP